MEPSTTNLTPADIQDKPPHQRSIPLRGIWQTLLIPLLAVGTAVLIGSIFILMAGLDPVKAYGGLLQGSLGSDTAIVRSLNKLTPLILLGLSVALTFKGGLFNIGAQGQLVMGSITAAALGFSVQGLPPALHIPLCLFGGTLAGALWGFIPGIMKAAFGAHEVITTIMLNYIASNLLEWAVSPWRASAPPGPLAFCRTAGSCAEGKTPFIFESARLPVLYNASSPTSEPLHIGLFIAIGMAILIYLLIYRTSFGFELRMVGLNPSAARYAGIKVSRMTIITMMAAGALAGLAGAIQTQGVFYNFQTNQNLGIGFNSIAVALLAANHPIGIIGSAALFGVMDAGSSQMQFASRVPIELIQFIQGLILMFIAADQIIRWLYRIRTKHEDSKVKLSTGWGQR